MAFQFLLSSRKFYQLSNELISPLAVATVVLFSFGIYASLCLAPADYQQGEGFRLIYVHVPSAYMSLMIYLCCSVCALVYLVFRVKLADYLLQSALPIGALFTFLALITGSIWGKPMWGTWWIWDARLTSEFVLLLWFLALIILSKLLAQRAYVAKAVSFMTLLGSINLPIIHFSVEWWHTLHQGPTLTKFSAPSMPMEMLLPLLILILASMGYFACLILIKMRNHILQLEHDKAWLRTATKVKHL